MLVAEQLFLLLRRDDGKAESAFAFSDYSITGAVLTDLLRAGAGQISDPLAFGFRVLPGYQRMTLTELREQIDHEFFILSAAHYQRYIAPVQG